MDIAPHWEKPSRPSILLIITDDQRYDTMDFMPNTKARIFDEGIEFSRAYVTTPVCCPSRSSILTGMYAHNHGVHFNQDPLSFETVVMRLHENGYFTGQVGKYLNSWNGTPRPEFDFWVSKSREIAGTDSRHRGYQTHSQRDFALEFLEQTLSRDQPFFLIFSTRYPHEPADPAPGDEELYPDLTPHRPPSFNEADLSDKPQWLAKQRPLDPSEIEEIDRLRRRQLQSLHAIDLAIDDLLNTLEAHRQLENTLVIFLSDNGFFWGEHRIEGGKNRVYEEAIHVPFAVRYPPMIQVPHIESRLVANIDIAPTIYEVAGIPLPTETDGRSLVSLMEERGAWREELLIEGWRRGDRYTAIHTGDYIYVENQCCTAEFYDLWRDPYQTENAIDDPAYEATVADLKTRLDRLRPTDDAPAAIQKLIRDVAWNHRIDRTSAHRGNKPI